jgi:hypothetical protein
MTYPFLSSLDTPGIRAARAANGVGELWETNDVDRPADRFSANETAFIAERDSFYLATVSQTGWPYIQHRGGPRGFLRVLDESTLCFADFRGNRHAGRGEIAGLIGAVQAQYPVFRFAPVGSADGHGEFARFSWSFGPENGEAVAKGTDFVGREGDRIAAVTGFLDASPAATGGAS